MGGKSVAFLYYFTGYHPMLQVRAAMKDGHSQKNAHELWMKSTERAALSAGEQGTQI